MNNATTQYARTFSLMAMLLLGLVLNNRTYATPKPEVTAPNLTELKEHSNDFFDRVYIASSAKQKESKPARIFISATHISFDSRWDKNFKSKVNSSYKKYVTETYAKLMQEQLTLAIEQSNRFSIAENQETADLILNTSIRDLYINGPEYSNATSTYVNFAGRAELHFEVTRKNGNPLAYFIDNRETRSWVSSNTIREATRARNYRDFKFLMKSWAENAIALLN